ncbi:nucleotidyltransferase domain-containing protein [Kitasatospora sp. NPDC006697]|uniref:nucleotidyltransferase domain-containing protein n=1 Tax=Kitasatospora sp. NPDC006697 TaxID=3364020 RepID=UPI0036CC3C59
MRGDTATEQVLERFGAELAGAVPLVALWVHGSLALGDYQPGRSDLDVLAVLERAPDAGELAALTALHQRLERGSAVAERLHCSYLVAGELAGAIAGECQLTWAHRELMERPVTLVTWRELELGGRCLLGPPPGELTPPVDQAALRAFIRRDLAEFWLPATGGWLRWRRDVWVDLGLFTLARATATLRDGSLLTKSQALDVLPEFGVSAALLRDLGRRRQGLPVETGWRWLAHRAQEARRVVRRGAREALAAYPD